MLFPAPLLLTNGLIYTMDDTLPQAEALAIDRASGRIVAVGSEADVRATLGVFSVIDIVDLKGRVVIPGMIDAHTHILATARDTIEVNLAGCADEAEAVARVVAHAATLPAGSWIVGRHWDQNEWPGQQFPTNSLLDAAISDHPVLLWAHSHHACWANRRALEMGGIMEMPDDPPGGVIVRDMHGVPTGLLFEQAIKSIGSICDEATASDVRTRDAFEQILNRFAARGLTGAHVMEGAISLRLSQSLADEHSLPVRLGYYLPVDQLPALQAIGVRDGFGSDMVRVHGIKIFADGALGSHTAAMIAPYADEPENTGLLTTSPAQMEQTIADALLSELSVAIHAIGDRAVQVTVESIEKALIRQNINLTRRRCRIEHVQLARESDLMKMARLGIVGSIQPYHAVSDRDIAERLWGERAAASYVYGTMMRMGIKITIGSDTPIETADPWRIIAAAVARTGDSRPAWYPAESLTVLQSLRGYTVGAAWASGRESYVGRLHAGYCGDCVILEEDPLRLPVEQLPDMPVVATIMGGRIVVGML
jgi:predicted amidohydrolase YtcJ